MITRCTECGRILWPWQRRGRLGLYQPCHSKCERLRRERVARTVYRYGGISTGGYFRMLARIKRDYGDVGFTDTQISTALKAAVDSSASAAGRCKAGGPE